MGSFDDTIKTTIVGEMGLGVVALREIKKDEIFFMERPFVVFNILKDDRKWATQFRFIATLFRMRFEGRDKEDVFGKMKMLHPRDVDDPAVKMCTPIVEKRWDEILRGFRSKEMVYFLRKTVNKKTFIHYYTKCRLNALGNDETYGLGSKSSCFNHSCFPNAQFVYLPKGTETTIGFVALSHIRCGEEITISYVCEPDDLASREKRRTHLKECWLFDCKCKHCLLQDKYESALFSFGGVD